jgi:hypothetical protein
MSAVYYGINVGETLKDITKSATPTGKDIELSVNPAGALNVTSKEQQLLALEYLELFIIQNPYFQ